MFLPFLRLRTAWFADVRVVSQFDSQLRACLFAFAAATPELVNFFLSTRLVRVRRLFMLLTYLFRICFGVRRGPARARVSTRAARRALRIPRAIPVRSLAVIAGIGTCRPAAAERGDARRTDVGRFEMGLRLEGPRTASISSRVMVAPARVRRLPVPRGRRLTRAPGTRRVVSRTMFAPRVRATLRTTTLRDALRARVRVKNAARERGDMRANSAALGRVTRTPGMFASARLAMSAAFAFGVAVLNIAPMDGDMTDAGRTPRVGFPERNGSLRISVNDGKPAFDAPFLRRYADTLFVFAPR
jgi:hypothetical protein